MKNNSNTAGAILVVGLAAVSVWGHVASDGEVGFGWAVWAVVILLAWKF